MIDIATWRRDEDFPVYPEGAREKLLVLAPEHPQYDFLIGNHRYLFKLSPDRCPDQYWTEIIAYIIGEALGVIVPPAYIAIDSGTGNCGALIEWFIGDSEIYVPGGDYLSSLIEGYDRKKGRQHNMDSIAQVMQELEVHEWKTWWTNTLLFDALIGNTDRHQDNWGVLTRGSVSQMAPAFDNGTSLGYELSPDRMTELCAGRRSMEGYIARGKHHIKRHAEDQRSQHIQLVKEACLDEWGMKDHLSNRIFRFDLQAISAKIAMMGSVEVPVPLSSERERFLRALVGARLSNLCSMIEGD